MVHNHMKLHAFQIDKSIVYKPGFFISEIGWPFFNDKNQSK